MGARYLTTTLPYVNADPHIGFALELVQADALVRTWRSAGDDVFFNTGTDEHGQKIWNAAQKAGKDVQAYVDHYAGEFRKLGDALGLDALEFIRTTDEKHVRAATEMWKRCEASGDIYLKEYEGLYCVGHEAFVMEKDLVDGKCPDHGAAPEILKEKNYFFRFSKYQPYLLEYLAKPGVIIPEWRRQEAIKFVEGGLEDFSISREKKRLSWGIPVPGDDTQVMYVWFDALTSYISTLGWPDGSDFDTYWNNGQTLQMAGKDQLRFQSLIWQAMLKSAGLKATDAVFYHGFITSDGKKMSKSIGNVISPYDLVRKYGTDATRYLLLRHVNPTEDSDVTWERLDEWYTANLTNGIGNLVARVMKLSEDNHVVALTADSNALAGGVAGALDAFEFKDAMEHVWQRIQTVDRRMNEEEPYKVVKTDPERGKAILQTMVQDLHEIGQALAPFMPDTSRRILEAVAANKKPENLFPRLA
ncbi:MAG TPA: methionine--tRNA ligase [Candidatus Paceibacterota bacterium]|nr:methionine--tRNA ligase [Candidatus Paceibacterota bacterium]